MSSWFSIPPERQVRALISSDAANEADDQFAIVHALLTPKIDVKGLGAAHFGTMFGPSQIGERASYDEEIRLVELLGSDKRVWHGAGTPLSDETTPIESEMAKAILAEARAGDERPLFALVLGPLTDVASALLLDPGIAERLTIVFIGGSPRSRGGFEFNLGNDLAAANVVFTSGAPVWQIPDSVYSLMKVSLATLAARVAPLGELGAHLFQGVIDAGARISQVLQTYPQFASLPPAERATRFPNNETWQLGDSPAVGVLLSDHAGHFAMHPAARVNRDFTYEPIADAQHGVRIYERVDSHMIIDDFFAKLEHWHRQRTSIVV
jgi:inosine-uridine nucleoside N-ribohydrolase